MIHNDHLGTPQKMTGASGTVVWAADYKPFGETEIDNQVTTITNNLRFPGQYYDAETGLNYNYFRDYNPVIGKYIQADPIGLKGGLNVYVYAANNSVIASDPLGLFCFSFITDQKITCSNFRWEIGEWKDQFMPPTSLKPKDLVKDILKDLLEIMQYQKRGRHLFGDVTARRKRHIVCIDICPPKFSYSVSDEVVSEPNTLLGAWVDHKIVFFGLFGIEKTFWERQIYKNDICDKATQNI